MKFTRELFNVISALYRRNCRNLTKLFHILDPSNSRGLKQNTFDQIDEIIPLTFDKVAVKLEHREFVVDNSVDFSESDAVRFWINIYNMKSPMGEYKYRNLALRLLAIPTSNADCERVFNHVRRIKTYFRSSLSTNTISSLIGCQFNKVTKCCEQTKFEESFLASKDVHTSKKFIL